MKVLSSQWGSLSSTLLARIYPVERMRSSSTATYVNEWARPQGGDGDIEVRFPMSEGGLDAAMNWTSPFEAVGAESKIPILASLLQSGAATSALSTLAGLLPDAVKDQTQQLADSLISGTESLEGKTGITKLNSTQIFSGMQPLKMNIVAHFRAWSDPDSEVTAPIDQLMSWALPKELSSQGFLQNISSDGFLRALFPSKVPQVLGFEYGVPDLKSAVSDPRRQVGLLISPVVIESISQPIVTPRDSNGSRLNVAVQMTICTLAAIDRNDYKAFKLR